MTNSTDVDRIDLFLAGARVVLAAVEDPTVRDGWNAPSVLADQTVGGIAGHLARGSVWAVGDYLAAGAPDGPVEFEDASAYFAHFVDAATDEMHASIRARGADVGSVGPEALAESLRSRLADLEVPLRTAGSDGLVSVIGGSVMRLADYLDTRLVEQAVHLDDLARSVGLDPWILPIEHLEIVVATGVGIAKRRRGELAVVRALYRSDIESGVAIFPVM